MSHQVTSKIRAVYEALEMHKNKQVGGRQPVKHTRAQISVLPLTLLWPERCAHQQSNHAVTLKTHSKCCGS